jgi:hypothetical protein
MPWAYPDARYSALALLGGAVVQAYLISAPEASVRGLLVASTLDVCQTSSNARGLSFAGTKRDVLSCLSDRN